ncbi:TolC family protein [bacterium]|nr:MAG: TolC family protein [bacterium]
MGTHNILLSFAFLLCVSTVRAQDTVPPTIAPDGSPVSQLPVDEVKPTTQPGASKPLSLAEALALAHQNAPTLDIAKARVEAAQARLQVARARPNPTLALAQPFTVTGQRGATGGFDEGVVASQIIEGPGKRSARSRSAQSERNASLFDLAGSGTSLDFAVKSAYFDAERAQSDREVALATLRDAQQFLQGTTEQEQAGDVPRRDVLRAQTEADRATSALVQSEADLKIRLQTLASLAGITDGALPQLSDSLNFAPVQLDAVALDELAMQRRGDVQSARATLEARSADIQGAKAARRPDFFAEARVAQIVPSAGDVKGSSLRVGISLPLFDFGSLKQGIAVARAGEAEQRATLADVQRTARLEVVTALQTLDAAGQVVKSFQGGRLQRAQTLLDLARTGYAEGASTLLDVLDARAIFRAEQADYNRALAAYNTALADVERSVGGVLPSSASLSPAAPAADTAPAPLGAKTP